MGLHQAAALQPGEASTGDRAPSPLPPTRTNAPRAAPSCPVLPRPALSCPNCHATWTPLGPTRGSSPMHRTAALVSKLHLTSMVTMVTMPMMEMRGPRQCQCCAPRPGRTCAAPWPACPVHRPAMSDPTCPVRHVCNVVVQLLESRPGLLHLRKASPALGLDQHHIRPPRYNGARITMQHTVLQWGTAHSIVPHGNTPSGAQH